MPTTWKQLSFIPSPEELQSLRDGWGWRVPGAMSAFLCAMSGDVFWEVPGESIHWLDTGAGALSRIAETRAEFFSELNEGRGGEWLMAPLMDVLGKAGKSPGPGQCFAYKQMPVLGGSHTVDNMEPVSASAWYSFSGRVHEQLQDLPEGTQVRFKSVEI